MRQAPDTAPAEPDSAPVTAGRDSLHSRRALVAGVVRAGVGAAALVAGAQPASAANGDTVTVRGSFTGSATTSISTSSGTGLAGTTSDFNGTGVTGTDASSGALGVLGTSTSGEGVRGTTEAPVLPAVNGI
jgi:hypothetical protein